MATDIYYDIDGNRRFKSLTDDSQPDAIELFRSDESKWRLHPLRKNPAETPGRPLVYDTARPASLKVSAGVIDDPPDSGSYTIIGALGGSAIISLTADAATIQAALRAGLTSGSNIVVSALTVGEVYTVDWGTTGAVADLTATSDALVPSGSTVNITNTQQGTASVNEKWQIRLRKAPPFLCTSWSAFDSLTFAATLVTAGSATQKETFSVTWNADTYEGNGYLQVSTTGSDIRTVGPFAYNVTADELKAIIEKHENLAGLDKVGVAQNGPGDYTITFDESFTNAPTVTVGDNTFKVPIGDEADIGVATAESDAILGTSTSADVTFEIEVREDSGKPRTIQESATLRKDLITSTPGQTTGVDNFLTEADLTGGTLALSGTSVKVGAGSAGSPSINFGNASGDTDTGFYRVGSNSFAAVAGGGGVFLASSAGLSLSLGFKVPIVTKTANFTATEAEHTILCDCTSGAITITLPAAVSHANRIYVIKKIDASGNAVTIDANASEEIDGATTKSLAAQWNTKTIQCNGTAWFILNDL